MLIWGKLLSKRHKQQHFLNVLSLKTHQPHVLFQLCTVWMWVCKSTVFYPFTSTRFFLNKYIQWLRHLDNFWICQTYGFPSIPKIYLWHKIDCSSYIPPIPSVYKCFVWPQIESDMPLNMTADLYGCIIFFYVATGRIGRYKVVRWVHGTKRGDQSHSHAISFISCHMSFQGWRLHVCILSCNMFFLCLQSWEFY